MTSTSASPAPRWLTQGILLLLALVAANLLAWRSLEPDLWGHIQYGEDWLSSGIMPRTATHTFTTPDHPWVNHENLFELAVAAGHRAVGGLGLMLFKCAAGLCLLAAMIRVAVRRQVPVLAAAVAVIPVAWGLGEFWLARPQLFSFLCFGLMLLAVERGFSNWHQGWLIGFRWLWLTVPLMMIWTNSHGGFAAGLCVLIAVLGLRSIELWWNVRRAAWPRIAHMAAIAVAATAAVLVNPYGYELPYWMLVSLVRPRPEVNEWASIMQGGVAVVPFLILSGLFVISELRSRAPRDWVQSVILFLIAIQAVGHMRHLAFFAIAFGFWMPRHLHSLWQQMVERRPSLGVHQEIPRSAARWLKLELGLVAVLLTAALANTFASFGVDRREYPVSAFEFMADEQIQGQLVVTFDWAQYALAALAPNTTVAFDGRYDTCYPLKVVDMHFDLIMIDQPERRFRDPDSGPPNPQTVLEYGNPNLVLLDRRKDPGAVAFLEQQPDWTPLYRDAQCQLWGRRCEFDNSSHTAFLPADRRRLTDLEPSGIAAWPGFPGRTGRNAFSPAVAERAAQSRRTATDISQQSDDKRQL